jgi:hypothetical protein
LVGSFPIWRGAVSGQPARAGPDKPWLAPVPALRACASSRRPKG